MSVSRSAFGVVVLSLLSFGPTLVVGPTASAQDTTASAADLLQKMGTLYPTAAKRPPSSPPTGDAEKDALGIRAQQHWEDSVRALAKAGDDYVRVLGDAAPDANALFYRGAGQILIARLEGASVRQAHFETAVEALRRYLDAAGEDAGFRADAEMQISYALLALGANDPPRLDDAIPHVRRAIELLQKDGRKDDAGSIASIALRQLKALGRSAETASLAEAIHASEGDFGASTPTIRLFAIRMKVAAGAKLPPLPEVKDVEGKTVDLAPAAGKPLLVHFFLTSFPNGQATGFREVETDIRPLWDRWHEKGLRVVGICMDYAIPAKQAEEMRAKWEEWGRKQKPRDGSLASCQEWAKAQGVAWPWTWDGTWKSNPVALTLGGVGQERPHAILVDDKGVIRWDGDAKPTGAGAFPGLAEEVGKLFP